MKNRSYPIDAVITWVDGNDIQHKEKRMKYGNNAMFKAEEIFYCVASIHRFAPWINKIYIVTDGQDPHIKSFIEKNFSRQIPIEIVDHKTIFKGYEEFLPTFNSISIESLTWRIPGLSEHYIEFNDDFMLAAPAMPEDFFTSDGKVVCYGKKYSSLLVRISRTVKRRWNGEKKVTFKETMLNAATLLGERWFFIKIYHTPRALLKSIYQEFFNAHCDILKKNISYRFRSHKQFNAEEIQYMLLYNSKRCILQSAHENLLYIKPKRKVRYTQKKLQLFEKRESAKFACINSLDNTSCEIQEKIIAWMQQRIGVKKKVK